VLNLRDSQLNKEFVLQLEERLTRNVTESDSLLRKQVVVDPNFLILDLDRIYFPSRKLDDLLALSLASWWLPEEFRYYVQFELHRMKNYFTLEDQVLFELLLSSKAEAIIFLMETNLWHTRDFFGNFLPKAEKMANTIKFFRKNKNIVKRPKRKRGYDDHGSRRPDHKWLESHDISFTEEQNLIEQKRDAKESTSHFLRGGFL
jgi:hypothetical protein